MFFAYVKLASKKKVTCPPRKKHMPSCYLPPVKSYLSPEKVTCRKRGMFYFFRLSHMSSLLPPWRTILRFFFSPAGFLSGKKNRRPNLFEIPKLGKIRTQSGLNHDFSPHVFFFMPNPEGKKTVKLSPSYLFFRSIDSFVCDNRKIKKPSPFASKRIHKNHFFVK